MSRYIDADVLKDKYNDKMVELLKHTTSNMSEEALSLLCGCTLINDMPTADVVDKKLYDNLLENSIISSAALNTYQTADMVEVVRCKDCVHLELLNSEWYYARCNWHGRLFQSFDKPDTRYYFCADAVRREE